MKINIKKLQRDWNRFGRIDPLWSILADPDKKGNRWEIQHFLRTGELEINGIMKYIDELKINIKKHKALDFGCGVGRLTQPLCIYFDEVYGVDISPSMLELAKSFNKYGDKCKYFLNDTDDLAIFASNYFDFIYSNLVLQHVAPKYAINYITEFLRILRPDGLLIFQIPSEVKITDFISFIYYIVPKILLEYKSYLNRNCIAMYGIKKAKIVQILKQHGGQMVDISENQAAGKFWISYQYCVIKI